jgi:carbamoyltransferase
MFGYFNNTKIRSLRERLRLLRYTEERISKRLKLWHVTSITPIKYPVYQEYLRLNWDRLSTLISLFLLQGEVSRAAAEDALSPGIFDDLLTAELLTRAESDTVVASVSIYPCSGFHFVTDHHYKPITHDYYEAPQQPVMHLGEDSYTLAYLLPPPPKGGKVLDLCTGSGVQAIMQARRAKLVIGVDINPRAVEFARFNAALNGVSAKCDFRCGSLYEAIGQDDSKRNERFDMIVANPPFVPSPHVGQDRILSRDGGPTGDEILSGILEGLLTRLKPEGIAVIISLFTDQKRASFRTKIKKWLRARSPVDFLLLRFFSTVPEDFAYWHTWRAFGDDFTSYSQRYKEWLNALRATQMTQLTNGVLALRISQNGSGKFRTIDLSVPTSPQRELIVQELAC